jgi:uncharacterized membrane protein YphA (DoxX/SURF4 family)
MTTAISTSGTTGRSARVLNAALWLAQLLLAAAFVMAGFMKTTMPMPELIRQMGWPGALPAALVRFIGVSELAAGIGLILPAITRIRPLLTPLAAAGLVLVMTLATLFHLARGEAHVIPINLAFAALAAFVAWGRFRAVPIRPRGSSAT